jgi:peptidoglycan/xylan/chitin deacetylase (PgdA/CDA1 family)
MYHYIRDLKNSKYPEIKGLDLNDFKEQIGYLKKYYNFITIEQLINSIDNEDELPPKAVLLTFDDAYIDHYNNVFPILLENKIQGAFYPPIKAITEHIVLDVNKIHFIIALCKEKAELVSNIFEELDAFRGEYQLESNHYYYQNLAIANRFDSADTVFIKKILQNGLDEQLRKIIVDKLFKQYVGIEEDLFSRELYLSTDNLKEMKSNGMHVGSHGFDHYWLNTLNYNQQEKEISTSLDYIKSIGGDINYLSMCYPYGAYNEDTIKILKQNNFKVAFTTKFEIATNRKENRYFVSRLDTNDFPKRKDQEPNEWYYKG